jgi:hypothetical protein
LKKTNKPVENINIEQPNKVERVDKIETVNKIENTPTPNQQPKFDQQPKSSPEVEVTQQPKPKQPTDTINDV